MIAVHHYEFISLKSWVDLLEWFTSSVEFNVLIYFITYWLSDHDGIFDVFQVIDV